MDTLYLRKAIFVSFNSPTNILEAEPSFDDCDQAIHLALTERLFASFQERARLTHPPRTTLHRRLAQSLAFRIRHFR
jgi:hypothetical protein